MSRFPDLQRTPARPVPEEKMAAVIGFMDGLDLSVMPPVHAAFSKGDVALAIDLLADADVETPYTVDGKAIELGHWVYLHAAKGHAAIAEDLGIALSSYCEAPICPTKTMAQFRLAALIS